MTLAGAGPFCPFSLKLALYIKGNSVAFIEGFKTDGIDC